MGEQRALCWFSFISSTTPLLSGVSEMENSTDKSSTLGNATEAMTEELGTAQCAYYTITLLPGILLSANMWNHLRLEPGLRTPTVTLFL